LHSNIKFCNGKIVPTPQLPFYHGNRQKLWQYLLTPEEFDGLSSDRIQRRVQIIDFLNNHKINYSDVISYCQRAEYNADDSNLYNIILNEQLLDIFSSQVGHDILFVFNTGSLFTNRGVKFFRDGRVNPGSFVFDMFVKLLIEVGIEVRIKFQNQSPILFSYENRGQLEQFKNIIRFDLYINQMRVNVVAGPSPADGDGKLHENLIFKRFERIFHYNNNLSLSEIKKRFKTYVYQTALLGNVNDLYQLNYD
jgi:hypothetical protein